ncbi:MAG TPA: hypothetical protein VM734_24785 [Kofleriaceae bacterium]|nr:hypothetical protein [Kofleriaceae bacterium]
MITRPPAPWTGSRAALGPGEERPVELEARLLEHAAHDLDAGARDPPRAAAVAGDRVHGADHHPGHAAGDHRRRARRGAAVVVARLEVDVHRRAGGAPVELGQGVGLGVVRAGAAVPALGQHAVAVDDHAPDQRVGRGPPLGHAGQLEAARHPHRVDPRGAYPPPFHRRSR